MDCRQIVVDYIEGRITTKEFLDAANADERVYQWLQSVVPAGQIGYYDTSVDENKPMKYISSKKRWGGEGREYLFEDTHTHRTRTVVQFF